MATRPISFKSYNLASNQLRLVMTTFLILARISTNRHYSFPACSREIHQCCIFSSDDEAVPRFLLPRFKGVAVPVPVRQCIHVDLRPSVRPSVPLHSYTARHRAEIMTHFRIQRSRSQGKHVERHRCHSPSQTTLATVKGCVNFDSMQ